MRCRHFVTVLCSGWIGGGVPWTSAFMLSSRGAQRSSRPSPMMVLGSTPSNVRIRKDVVIIGGGLAGLSTALELAKRGRQVTVVSRSRTEAAAEAAGGMIAPQAERLDSGPYLDLCLTSRSMYAEWVASIEAIAGIGGDTDGGKAETHFWSTGGFISPAFEGDDVHQWNPPPEGGQAHWLDRNQALEMEPSLSPQIVGAWWFPQDMSIDAQRMFRVLEQACSKGGVEILQGTSAASLVYGSEGKSVDAVVLDDGRRFYANVVVSATGAWMRELMPVPMVPHKGQMMSLRQPASGRGAGAPRQGGGIGLTRVFFAEGCYIIPKRDGRIVVGSTVEVGEYGLHNTPAGMKQIIDAAVKVCPALADLAIERTWAGLRPVTPDTLPVLGPSSCCRNLFVAGGYWRNGVLLAPKTAQLVADAVCERVSPEDEAFLQSFSMDRFTIPRVPAPRAPPPPAAAAAAAASPRKKEPMGTGMGKFSSEASPSEILEMERAALEGSNDGDMLAALEGMFGKGMVQVEAEKEEEQTTSAPAPKITEPVNDYHASEEFSEAKLREARMSNRLVQEGSDARLEAMFGDDAEGDTGALSDSIGGVNSWDDGAAEVASMIGAELVEMEVDIPEGMSVEEALGREGPMVKVLWENPSGEDVEIPRGMNIASMIEAGLIPPLEPTDEAELGAEVGGGGTSTAGGGAGGDGTVGAGPGTFDPTAVKGAEERSTEVSELYAKVIANKAAAKAAKGASSTAFGVGSGSGSVTSTQNGYGGIGVKDGINGTNSWLSGVLGKSRGSGSGSGSDEIRSAETREPQRNEYGADDGYGHRDRAAIGAEAGAPSVPSDGGDGETVEEEMVGYDFILQDRGDKEGKVAKNARAMSRNVAEGEEAWESYEDIANSAMASMAGMDSVQYLPP